MYRTTVQMGPKHEIEAEMVENRRVCGFSRRRIKLGKKFQ